jgi:hypothetical protein
MCCGLGCSLVNAACTQDKLLQCILFQAMHYSAAASHCWQRLHKPIIGSVLVLAAGAPKALYGFEPCELVGKPLAATVDVFGLWRHQFDEDGSLLALLAAQAMEETAGSSSSKSSVFGISWRVGVHLPVKTDAEITEHAAAMAGEAEANTKVGTSSAIVGLLQCIFSSCLLSCKLTCLCVAPLAGSC